MSIDITPTQRVLVVDDEPKDLELLLSFFDLITPMPSIETAENYAQACASIKAETFDLIIIDINLAGESGVELCRKVKMSEGGKWSKVIVCSSLLDGNFFRYARDAGADCILTKDRPKEIWRETIHILLDLKLPSPRGLVLLVHRDAMFLRRMRMRLEALHIQVITAESGPEAIGKAVTEQPDLIMLDTHIPEFGGSEVNDSLKKISRTRPIPVIMLRGPVTPSNN